MGTKAKQVDNHSNQTDNATIAYSTTKFNEGEEGNTSTQMDKKVTTLLLWRGLCMGTQTLM